MEKAEICKDGWIRCTKHGKKLGRVDADGIKLWCSHDRSEVIIDYDALTALTKERGR